MSAHNYEGSISGGPGSRVGCSSGVQGIMKMRKTRPGSYAAARHVRRGLPHRCPAPGLLVREARGARLGRHRIVANIVSHSAARLTDPKTQRAPNRASNRASPQPRAGCCEGARNAQSPHRAPNKSPPTNRAPNRAPSHEPAIMKVRKTRPGSYSLTSRLRAPVRNLGPPRLGHVDA